MTQSQRSVLGVLDQHSACMTGRDLTTSLRHITGHTGVYDIIALASAGLVWCEGELVGLTELGEKEVA